MNRFFKVSLASYWCVFPSTLSRLNVPTTGSGDDEVEKFCDEFGSTCIARST